MMVDRHANLNATTQRAEAGKARRLGLGDSQGLHGNMCPAFGNFPDSFGTAAVRSVNGVFGAKRLSMGQYFFDNVGKDHAGAERDAKQHCRKTDSTRSVNRQPLAGLQRRPVGQRVPGRRDSATERGCEGRHHVFRQACQILVAGHGDKFREGAGFGESGQPLVETSVAFAGTAICAGSASQDERRNQSVARRVLRGRAGSHDFSAILMTADLAGLYARMFTSPAMPVAAAHAACQHLQDYAVLGAGRFRDVLDGKRFFVSAKNGGSHQGSSTS